MDVLMPNVDPLNQVLLTKPAEVVQEACQVLEKHGYSVKKLKSELYYSSTLFQVLFRVLHYAILIVAHAPTARTDLPTCTHTHMYLSHPTLQHTHMYLSHPTPPTHTHVLIPPHPPTHTHVLIPHHPPTHTCTYPTPPPNTHACAYPPPTYTCTYPTHPQQQKSVLNWLGCGCGGGRTILLKSS